MTSQVLSDADWNALDELRCNLGCGSESVAGGWFEISPEQIHALEALINRLGCEDEHVDAVTRFQVACGELLRQIAEGDCQLFEMGQVSACEMIEDAMRKTGVDYKGQAAK